jgi:hypothetical protein
MHAVTNRFFILQIVLLLIFLPISAEYIYNKKIIIIIPFLTHISLPPNLLRGNVCDRVSRLRDSV